MTALQGEVPDQVFQVLDLPVEVWIGSVLPGNPVFTKNHPHMCPRQLDHLVLVQHQILLNTDHWKDPLAKMERVIQV